MKKIKELMEEYAKKLTDNFEYLITDDISGIDGIVKSMVDFRLFKPEYKDTYIVLLIFEKQTKILCASSTIFYFEKKDKRILKVWKRVENKLYLQALCDICKFERSMLIGFTKIHDKIKHRFTVARVIGDFGFALMKYKGLTKFIEVQGSVLLPNGMGDILDIKEKRQEELLGKTRRQSTTILHFCKKLDMEQIIDCYADNSLGLVFCKHE